jgi:hypothetical protein
LQPDAAPPGNALNDLLFLQRMYDAGAAPYFDVMAMQAYGLWSGPTDRRMHPRVMNFGRPQFVRDLMVANGDAKKPIWISEMGWNAVPADVPDKRFGQASLEQQARFAPMAYQRVQEEWPWAGVVNTWYLKRATDDWVKQGRPEAYFRLLDPDFTVQPVFESVKAYITGGNPTVYQGIHSPLHWAIQAKGPWQTVKAPDALFGELLEAVEPGAQLRFHFKGSRQRFVPGCSQGTTCTGSFRARVDNGPAVEISAGPVSSAGDQTVPVVSGLAAGLHQVVIEVVEAPVGLAAVVVDRPGLTLPQQLVGLLAILLVLILLLFVLARALRALRRARRVGKRVYTPPKVYPRPKPLPPWDRPS